MKKEIVTKYKSNRPFSAAIQYGPFVFVSGQGGIDPETGKIVGDDLESQTVQTLENIRRILAEAGLTMDDVVKTLVFLKNRDDYEKFNEVYSRFFNKPYPARSVVYCDLNWDILVEIEAVAAAKQD